MCSSSRIYEDILAPRRAEFSNFMWASRQLTPQVAHKQEKKPTPQSHKDEVLNSRKVQELLEAISSNQNVPKLELERQVRNILDEIGYNRKMKVIRWLGLVLVKICNRVCTGIYTNQDAMSKLKLQMGDCPVIFVPSHRSYADFILMSLLCFNEDVAIPAIAAGMDFHGMMGMGTVLRDNGAFFMRRSYNDDQIYWTTFKQYVLQLVTRGELPIEFFIEGTRSRSNKSLVPKYGLILMILKAFFLSQVPDILFVPITICYDRILEEKLFAFELLGVPKPKESTSGLFKSLSIVREKYGSIYLHMAEPISAKEFFGADLDKAAHALGPIHQQEISEKEKKLIPALAHEIVYQQQKHCVLTTFNLIAIILNNNVCNKHDLLHLDELIREVEWLKGIVETLGGFIEPGDVKLNVLRSFEVHKNVIVLDKEQKVGLVTDKITIDKARTQNLKAHDLSEKTLTSCVPFIMLQIYINPVLHYIIDVAIIIITLKDYKEMLTEEELFTHYKFLRSLFSHEFVTFHSREKVEFDLALQNCFRLNVIRNDNGRYELGENRKCGNVMHNCIDAFIFTYFTVSSILLQGPKVVDEKAIIIKVQMVIESRINQHKFVHPYSLSLDTISNCLSVFTSQQILIKSRSKNQITYEVNLSKLLSVKDALGHFVDPILTDDETGCVQPYLKTKL